MLSALVLAASAVSSLASSFSLRGLQPCVVNRNSADPLRYPRSARCLKSPTPLSPLTLRANALLTDCGNGAYPVKFSKLTLAPPLPVGGQVAQFDGIGTVSEAVTGGTATFVVWLYGIPFWSSPFASCGVTVRTAPCVAASLLLALPALPPSRLRVASLHLRRDLQR